MKTAWVEYQQCAENVLSCSDINVFCTSECIQTIQCDGAMAVGVVDSNTVVIGRSRDWQLWNVATGKCLYSIEMESENPCLSITLLDDSRFLFGGWNRQMTLWDLNTKQCVQTFNESVGQTRFRCTHKLSDNRIIASGCGQISIWDEKTGKCLKFFDNHGSVFLVLPNGKIVSPKLSHKKNCAILQIWDPNSGECLRLFDCESTMLNIYVLESLPDGRLAIGGGDLSGQVRIWDIPSGQCIKRLNGRQLIMKLHKEELQVCLYAEFLSLRIRAMKTFGDGTILFGVYYSVGTGNDPYRKGELPDMIRGSVLQLWDVDLGRCIGLYVLGYNDFSEEVTDIQLLAEDKIVFTVDFGGIHVWRLSHLTAWKKLSDMIQKHDPTVKQKLVQYQLSQQQYNGSGVKPNNIEKNQQSELLTITNLLLSRLIPKTATLKLLVMAQLLRDEKWMPLSVPENKGSSSSSSSQNQFCFFNQARRQSQVSLPGVLGDEYQELKENFRDVLHYRYRGVG
jgi:WD40 repeat protein